MQQLDFAGIDTFLENKIYYIKRRSRRKAKETEKGVGGLGQTDR